MTGPDPLEHARRTILHALSGPQKAPWTRQRLATWFELPLGVVEIALRALVVDGLVRPVPGLAEGYEPIVPITRRPVPRSFAPTPHRVVARRSDAHGDRHLAADREGPAHVAG
jgi:hypothetical protein